MTASIRAIHVAKKQLGLDDDTYRAKLMNITGKASAKDMSEAERQKVLVVFRNDGFAPKPADRRPDGRQKLEGRFVKKLQALWIAGWNLGLVDNRDDAALVAFVKRQTGVDHIRFLHHADDAAKAIEGLKAWLAREGGVKWRADLDWLKADGAKIAWAQWRILKPQANLITRYCFDEAVEAINGCHLYMPDHGWIVVMNALGERVRALRSDRVK